METLQRTPPNQDYPTNEPAHPPSPKYNRDNRNSYHQYDVRLIVFSIQWLRLLLTQ